jgi:hypothetical protein
MVSLNTTRTGYLKELYETLLEVKLVHLGGRGEVAGTLHRLSLGIKKNHNLPTAMGKHVK